MYFNELCTLWESVEKNVDKRKKKKSPMDKKEGVVTMGL